MTGSLLGSLAVGRFGRKTLLLVSSFMCSLSMGLLGLSVWVRDQGGLRISGLDWAPLICLIAFTLSNTLGLGCVPWVLMGEMFPGWLFQLHLYVHQMFEDYNFQMTRALSARV